MHSAHHAHYISRLQLYHFRNHVHYKIETDARPVVITGGNGTGKTSILEAISLLNPGKGLRAAQSEALIHKKEELEKDASMPALWKVKSIMHHGALTSEIETGNSLDIPQKRRIIIDGKSSHMSANPFSHPATLLWLTPDMDGLLSGSAKPRREFLDRLVYSAYPRHAEYIRKYEHAMKERARLLKKGTYDTTWIETLEHTMVIAGIAITKSRLTTIKDLQEYVFKTHTPFPQALLSLMGTIEDNFATQEQKMFETWYHEALRHARAQDRASGRTHIGIHRSDLAVWHRGNARAAELCSTGEQKALLFSLMLAHIRAQSKKTNHTPLLLLDETVAHLDRHRRAFLFKEIEQMRIQAWMTGTDPLLFSEWGEKAQYFAL